MSHQWYESYNYVHHSIMDYISLNCTDHNYGIMIRDLWHYRDSCDPHVVTATEIVQLNEYLYIYRNIGIFVIICTYLFILNVVLYYYDCVKIIIILYYYIILYLWHVSH